MTNTKFALAAIAAVAIIASGIIATAQTSNNEAFAQQVPATPMEKTVSVTGTATASADPNLLRLMFGVETEAKTAKESIEANSAAMNKVVDALKKLGITEDELGTSSFNIYPIYNNTVDPKTGIYVGQELSGYRTSNILSVKTEKLNMAGTIIDAAVSAGANRVDSVYFSLSPEKQQSIQDELIEKAVLNAKSKAEKALAPLGQKIVGVKTVNLSDFSYPPPVYYPYAGDALYKAEAAPPIFSSNQDVTTTANVVFLIGEE